MHSNKYIDKKGLPSTIPFSFSPLHISPMFTLSRKKGYFDYLHYYTVQLKKKKKKSCIAVMRICIEKAGNYKNAVYQYAFCFET